MLNNIILYSSNPNPKLFLNKTFVFENKKYTIKKINKFWGKTPCFLGYLTAINDDFKKEDFVFLIKVNINSKEEKDRWIYTVINKK